MESNEANHNNNIIACEQGFFEEVPAETHNNNDNITIIVQGKFPQLSFQILTKLKACKLMFPTITHKSYFFFVLDELNSNFTRSIHYTNEELPSESSDIADLLAESSDDYVPSSESSSEGEQQTPAKVLMNRRRKGRDEGKISRKRKINSSNWKKNVSKQQKLQGKEYVTLKGKLIRAKRMKPPCNCRKKCFDLMSNEERKIIFKNFYQLSYDGQSQFISDFVEEKEKATQRLRRNDKKESRRQYSRRYFLNNNGNIRLEVCQEMFTKTLDITIKRIRVCVEKKRASKTGMCASDKRGKHGKQPVIPEKEKDFIRTHINQFPSYESHYSRSHSQKKYLQSHLSISQMYRLYKEECVKNNVSPQKESMYRKIFVEEFNLSFHKPKNDTCGKCDKFEMLIKTEANESEKNKIIVERDSHMLLATSSYDEKKNDVEKSKTNEKIMTVSFDLQKCLPTPLLSSGISFYKRQLWTLNLTLYITSRNQNPAAICYLWDETIAARGGREIASCLYAFLKQIPVDIEEVNFFSDSCPGQNRNIFVALMFLFLTKELSSKGRKIVINHKFLEAGHTHMEADSVHALIEKTRKKTNALIELPRDWANLIRMIPRKPPIIVHEMQQDQFLNFKELLETAFVQKKVNTAGEPVKWTKIKWMQFRWDKPNEMQYKIYFGNDEQFKTISFVKKNTRHSTDTDFNLRPISNKPLPLSNEKLKDLKDLMQYIQPNSRIFYNALVDKLTSSSDVVDTFSDSDYDED